MSSAAFTSSPLSACEHTPQVSILTLWPASGFISPAGKILQTDTKVCRCSYRGIAVSSFAAQKRFHALEQILWPGISKMLSPAPVDSFCAFSAARVMFDSKKAAHFDYYPVWFLPTDLPPAAPAPCRREHPPIAAPQAHPGATPWHLKPICVQKAVRTRCRWKTVAKTKTLNSRVRSAGCNMRFLFMRAPAGACRSSGVNVVRLRHRQYFRKAHSSEQRLERGLRDSPAAKARSAASCSVCSVRLDSFFTPAQAAPTSSPSTRAAASCFVILSISGRHANPNPCIGHSRGCDLCSLPRSAMRPLWRLPHTVPLSRLSERG